MGGERDELRRFQQATRYQTYVLGGDDGGNKKVALV